MKKIKDLANFLELREDGMKDIRAGLQAIGSAPVATAKTTVAGGGQTGDTTAASHEHGEDAEDTTAVSIGDATQVDFDLN